MSKITHHYEVVVGNLGTTYRGPSKHAAHADFRAYVALSKGECNRAVGEPVVLTCDGEIVKDYQPPSQWLCEYTDTFGGEANYSWVRRVTVTIPDSASDLTIVRMCKAALGLTGVKGVTENYGDSFRFTPNGSCTVAFFNFDNRS